METVLGFLLIGGAGYLWYKGWLHYVLWLVIGIICLLIYFVISADKDEKEQKERTRKQEDLLNSKGFVFSKSFTGLSCNLYIDDENKQIAMVYADHYDIWYYNDIIGYRTKVNERVISETKSTGTIKEGLLGTKYVDIKGGDSHSVVDSVYFLIMTNNMNSPVLTFQINTHNYTFALTELEAVFKNILLQNEKLKQS